MELFAEVQYWERLHYEVPYAAMDIAAHRERYRCLRENVMLVVRDYNGILGALTPTQRRLFSENLHKLDRKVAPGALLRVRVRVTVRLRVRARVRVRVRVTVTVTVTVGVGVTVGGGACYP